MALNQFAAGYGGKIHARRQRKGRLPTTSPDLKTGLVGEAAPSSIDNAAIKKKLPLGVTGCTGTINDLGLFQTLFHFYHQKIGEAFHFDYRRYVS